MSTMTAAAQGADNAVEFELSKLEQLRATQRAYREEIEKATQRARELTAQLPTVDQEVLSQEQRVAVIRQTFADHAEALVRVMAELDLKPQEIPPNPLAMVQGQDAGSPMGDRVQQETTSTQAFQVQDGGGQDA